MSHAPFRSCMVASLACLTLHSDPAWWLPSCQCLVPWRQCLCCVTRSSDPAWRRLAGTPATAPAVPGSSFVSRGWRNTFFLLFCQAHHCVAFIQKHSSIITIFLSLTHLRACIFFLFPSHVHPVYFPLLPLSLGHSVHKFSF